MRTAKAVANLTFEAGLKVVSLAVSITVLPSTVSTKTPREPETNGSSDGCAMSGAATLRELLTVDFTNGGGVAIVIGCGIRGRTR